MLDVLIIGAGPAGLSCAADLKKRGLSVKILEEHKEIGVPVQCSGLISWNLSRYTRIDDSFIERKVHTALIHSPSGITLKAEKKRPVYVIDRNMFDKYLAKGLENDIIFNERIIRLKFEDTHVSLFTENNAYKAKMIVGADGPLSVVARHFGVSPKTATGLIAMVDEKPENDIVELFYNRKITEHFLWKIPRNGKTEYGMMGKKPKIKELMNFFSLQDADISGGLIPMKPAEKTYFERAILLGDAAGQVKPWSGGGVVYALLSSQIAANVIEAASKTGDFSENSLHEYEKGWKKVIGKQIAVGNAWNAFLNKSNNAMIDALFAFMKLIPLSRIDMDFLI
ncbi:MAG: geranylgeranyl reductase family protein [Candidatus Micrarchaeota archaeon]|nr:geranylgeranyl reductase family protein [Candidatus Micrarchaeota archaeon]